MEEHTTLNHNTEQAVRIQGTGNPGGSGSGMELGKRSPRTAWQLSGPFKWLVPVDGYGCKCRCPSSLLVVLQISSCSPLGQSQYSKIFADC